MRKKKSDTAVYCGSIGDCVDLRTRTERAKEEMVRLIEKKGDDGSRGSGVFASSPRVC